MAILVRSYFGLLSCLDGLCFGCPLLFGLEAIFFAYLVSFLECAASQRVKALSAVYLMEQFWCLPGLTGGC